MNVQILILLQAEEELAAASLLGLASLAVLTASPPLPTSSVQHTAHHAFVDTKPDPVKLENHLVHSQQQLQMQQHHQQQQAAQRNYPAAPTHGNGKYGHTRVFIGNFRF